MFSTKKVRALAMTASLVVLAAIAASTATSSSKATTVRIWTDADRKAAVEKVAGAWGTAKGVQVEVVQKDFGKIRDDLKTVQPETAPDVIVGAHDWVGQLSVDGSIVPLVIPAATKAQFPAYSLNAMSYGTAVKRLYGVPVALENVGLVVNKKLASAPKTIASLQAQALKFQKKASGNIGLAVPQGANGDAYHMYPFFSGLCGYVFGTNSAGNLDPSNIGVANPKFLKNAKTIDGWNKTGFLNSKIDYGVGKDAFLAGKAAFWITGPWEADTLKKSGLSYTIAPFPSQGTGCASVPFLGVQGFMVTKFAAAHGVESAAKDLVAGYFTSAASQAALAAANGRFPANTQAAKLVNDPVLKLFGKASAGGVPMPNIPQMSSVWSELGGAWVKSTKGSGAVPARASFVTASRNIANKIG
jgi:arabinogalactan oligomer/maltooligosaccharide transport system substrate-binding protein